MSKSRAHEIVVALAVMVFALPAGCSRSGQSTANLPPSLPRAYNAVALPSTSVVVTIEHDVTTNTDTIQIDGRGVSDRDISDRLKSLIVGSNRGVNVEAAGDSSFATLVTVIHTALAAGYNTFGLANRVIEQAAQPGLAGFEFDRRPAINNRIDYIDDRLPVEVEVTGGRIAVDGKTADYGRLYDSVRQAIAYHRMHLAIGFKDDVLVIPALDTSWNIVIRVLDAARQARDDHVDLVLSGPPSMRFIRMDPTQGGAQ